MLCCKCLVDFIIFAMGDYGVSAEIIVGTFTLKIALHKLPKSGFTQHKLIDGRIFATVGLEWDIKGMRRRELFDEEILMLHIVQCWH